MSRKTNTRKGATPSHHDTTRATEGLNPANQPKNKTNNKKTCARSGFKEYQQHHHYAWQSALIRVRHAPIATLLTVIVIAIALSLPAALQILIKNTAQFSHGWQNTMQISLYLRLDISDEIALKLKQSIEQKPIVQKVDFISKEKALEEFKNHSGFAGAIAQLDDNPLPSVLVVTPNIPHQDTLEIQKLFKHLTANPAVETTQMDFEWVKRLMSILAIIKQVVFLITLFLIFSVIVVIGNTIRLMGQSYMQEIEISKLVGATDAFVRRPFLYTGSLYGFVGSIFACLCVTGAVAWLNDPVHELATLYHNTFTLINLSLSDIVTLLCLGVILGFGGAWIASNQFLKHMD